jgi:predicted enzyme related to lactoylglutathione lyase
MSETPTGKFVWFEYVAKDQPRAQTFYNELFQWKTRDVPAPGLPGGKYTMIAAGDDTIGGYVPTPDGAPAQAHWLAHLQVADAQASAAKIKSLGGKVRKEPTKMGEMGTWAVVSDPFDGVFALWQPAKADGSGDFKGKVNTWVWNELTTEQPDKSVAFYKAIGGFEEEKMDMGGAGAYYLLKTGGLGRAGVAKTMKPGIPQMWTPYVQVAKTDEAVERVKKLGGKILLGGQDIPDVGRIAIIADPLGAMLGLLQPAMK